MIPETNREATGDSILGWYVTNEGDILEVNVWNVEGHDKVVVNYNIHDLQQLATVETYITATKEVNFFLHKDRYKALIAAMGRLTALAHTYVKDITILAAKGDMYMQESRGLERE